MQKRPQLLYKVVQVNKKGKKMGLNCVRFHIMVFIDDMYFLRAAEMCAYLPALQNRIFRLLILSERRGMDCMRSILLAKRILALQSHVI